MSSQPGRWVDLPDGRRVAWPGIYSGPVVLSDDDIAQLALRLLGLSLAEVEREARARLPSTATMSGDRPAVIVYSATPLKMGYEASVQSIVEGRAFEDPASYVETRSVYLAGPNDLVVGRLQPWREAAKLAGLESVAVDCFDHYYFSHALLKLAADHPHGGVAAIDQLLRWVRAHPTAVVKVYALDRPVQVFLLWLVRLAGLDHLEVYANDSSISDNWGRKAKLHPWVMDVLDLPRSLLSGDPYALMGAEHERAAFPQELGLRLPGVPGYTIRPAAADVEDVVRQFLLAATFLRERYGLRLGCFKLSRTGTGEGIRPGVDLTDDSELRALARQAAVSGEESVLEAHLFYSTLDVGGYRFKLAPSAHIEAGAVAPGLTLQFLRDTAWEGNVYFDGSHRLGLDANQFEFVRETMEHIVRAFGLAKGGVDFGVGRLTGRFGQDIAIAVQDLNLFSHGAEYLRMFLAKNRRRYGATKVVRPSIEASLDVLVDATRRLQDAAQCQPIASVPGQWMMIAVAAADPVQAVERVLEYERHLVACKLIAPA